MVFDNVLSPVASNYSAAGRKQKYARWSSANDTWASLSFTVTITLVLAPVPPQSRPFNRPDYVRTKRPAAIEANRAITCRKNNARSMIPIVPSRTFYKSAEKVLRSSELNESFEKFRLPLRPSQRIFAESTRHDHWHVFPKNVARFTENWRGRISLSVVRIVAFRAAVFFLPFFFLQRRKHSHDEGLSKFLQGRSLFFRLESRFLSKSVTVSGNSSTAILS